MIVPIPFPATLKGFINTQRYEYDTIGYREFQLSEFARDSKSSKEL